MAQRVASREKALEAEEAVLRRGKRELGDATARLTRRMLQSCLRQFGKTTCFLEVDLDHVMAWDDGAPRRPNAHRRGGGSPSGVAPGPRALIADGRARHGQVFPCARHAYPVCPARLAANRGG